MLFRRTFHGGYSKFYVYPGGLSKRSFVSLASPGRRLVRHLGHTLNKGV